MQNVKEVRKYCEVALKKPGKTPGESAKLKAELGGTLAISGEFEEAKKAFYEAIQHVPSYAAAFSNLSRLYGLEGNFDKAEEYGAKSHQLDAETHELNWFFAREGKRMTDKLKETPFPALFYKRGLLFGMQGSHEKAIEDFSKAVELDPDFYDAYKMLGDAHLRLGNLEEAIQAYDEVADRVHDYDFGDENFLYAVKRWEHLTKKIELNPRASDCAQVAIFYANQKTKQTSKIARKYFVKALELDPRHDAALNGLREVESALIAKGLIRDGEPIGPPPQVPNILGQSALEAAAHLRGIGLEPKMTYKKVRQSNKLGTVLSVQPAGGTVLAHGQSKEVNLTVGHRGIDLTVIEGIGPKFQKLLAKSGVSSADQLILNPDIGDQIPDLSAKVTRLWASMATWLYVLPDTLDGNAAELAMVGLGMNSPDKAYHKFKGKSKTQIKQMIKRAARKVKLPKTYVDENLEILADFFGSL